MKTEEEARRALADELLAVVRSTKCATLADLDAEWNAALDSATRILEQEHETGMLSASKWMHLTERLNALKREVEP